MKMPAFLALSLLCGCYPSYQAIPVPVFISSTSTTLSDAQLKQGLEMCTQQANASRKRAYDAHRNAFWSRRIGAVTTILAGSGATATSAAGEQDLATVFGATTVLSGLFTAMLVDETESTAAEAGQQQTLAQLAAVREAYQRLLQADAAEKPQASARLSDALLACGYNPVPALN